MTGKSNLVVLAGGGLLAVNVFYDKTFASVRQDVTSGTATSASINTSPVHMVIVGLLTLMAATVIAGASDSAANIILLLLGIFWLLWLMSYSTQKKAQK